MTCFGCSEIHMNITPRIKNVLIKKVVFLGWLGKKTVLHQNKGVSWTLLLKRGAAGYSVKPNFH